MTGTGQPQTCSHPINARTLTGVCQVFKIFSAYTYSYKTSTLTDANKFLL